MLPESARSHHIILNVYLLLLFLHFFQSLAGEPAEFTHSLLEVCSFWCLTILLHFEHFVEGHLLLAHENGEVTERQSLLRC